MNMQLIKQVQALQKDMLKAKTEIDNSIFDGSNSLVRVQVNGKKEITNIKIDSKNFNVDDIEILEDMIMLAINDAFKKVDKTTEEKMGKFSNSMPGLF